MVDQTKKAFISINGQRIRGNAIRGTDDPPIRIAKSKNDKVPIYVHEIRINGPSTLIYSPTKAILACGARLVLQTAMEAVEILR